MRKSKDLTWMGIDPGETTGVAIWHEGFEQLQYTEQVDSWRLFSEHRGGGVRGILEVGAPYRLAAERLAVLVEKYQPDIIVVEDFILRAGVSGGFAASGARAGLSPIHIIAKLDVWLFDILDYKGEIIVQQAAQAKGVMTNQRMKDRGWWVRGQPHATDAARHIAVAYRRRHSVKGMVSK